MGKNIMDDIAEEAFVCAGAGEGVITQRAELFSARALGANEGRREGRKAEVAKKGKMAGVIIEALVFVLTGKAV